jgi:hypothetical protein
MPRRLITLLALLTLTGGLAACGNKQDVVTKGETEGTYLDVGPLKYQVQISRALNPRDVEDRTYLVGLPKDERALPPDNVWFAIFVRVENESKQSHFSAEDFSIETTQNETFEPVPLGSVNTFAYKPANMPSKTTLPVAGSVPAEVGINGNLLLFKIPRTSLENRPLEFKIKSPGVPQAEGTVALDV